MGKKILHITVIMLLIFMQVEAQITTSGVNGMVMTNEDAAIGATVKVVHEPSNTSYTSITNKEGRFSVTGMRIGGPYKIIITYLGYNTEVLNGITLQLGITTNVNVNLKEDTKTLDEVKIVGRNSKFAIEKIGITTNINNTQLTTLPTINRSLSDLARLSPYANNGSSFAGTDGRMSGFTIDGANLNNNFGLSNDLPGGGNPISLDAIEEMQVTIAPFDVRQSNFIGGAINAITKSGTNQFKGSAYSYQMNEKMRGNRIDQIGLGDRVKESTSIYGFTLGGPLVKDKLFFFVNGEYKNSPYQITKFRPRGIADEQQNSSRVTEADMNEFAEILKRDYGYDAGSYNNYDGGNTNYKALVRIDWNISNAHKLSLRYNYTLNQKDMPSVGGSSVGGRTASNRTSSNAMAFNKNIYIEGNDATSLVAELNSRFSNRIANRLIATYSNMGFVQRSDSEPFPHVDIWDGKGDAYMSAGYYLFAWNNRPRNIIFNVQDNIVVYLNKHTITAGLSFEYQKAYNMFMRFGTGFYKYESFDAFKQKDAPIAFGLTYGYNGEKDPKAEVSLAQSALYIQDEWKINDRFLLSLGLRADMLSFLNPLETNKGYYDIDFNGRRIDTGIWPKSNVLIAPRIGFAWDITEDKSIRLRGGSGIFTGRIPLVFFTNMPTNSGMLQNTAQVTDPSVLDKLKGGMITDVNKMIDVLGLPTTPSFNSKDDVSMATIVGVDPTFKMPQIWKSTLAIDYQPNLPFPMTISAEYMYSKSINAIYQENLNVIDPSNLPHFNGPDNRLIYPGSRNLAISSKVTGGATLLKNTNKGYSSTVAATITAEPVKNLSLMMAYAHSQSRDISANIGIQAYSSWQNTPSINGPNLVGLHASQYLTPNKVIASLSYKIEYGKNFASHIGVFYCGYNPDNYSYIYYGDMNQDGVNNDLMYIPKTKNELLFIDKNGIDAATQAEAFWNFVEQDPYLKKNKGKYAEAYGAYLPWMNRFDIRLAQDFKIKMGKTWNTLQLSIDILNFGNMINNAWGVPRSTAACNSGNVLMYEGVNNDNIPQYSMFYNKATQSLPSYTFESNRKTINCWQLQIGLRYIFN